MACRLFGAKPLSQPMLEYWNFNRNFSIFIHANVSAQWRPCCLGFNASTHLGLETRKTAPICLVTWRIHVKIVSFCFISCFQCFFLFYFLFSISHINHVCYSSHFLCRKRLIVCICLVEEMSRVQETLTLKAVVTNVNRLHLIEFFTLLRVHRKSAWHIETETRWPRFSQTILLYIDINITIPCIALSR